MFVVPALPGIRWSYVCARCVRGARPGPLSILLILASLVPPLHAQTIDDGIMMNKRSLFAGYVYSHESRDLYSRVPSSALPGTRCGSRVWMALIADR